MCVIIATLVILAIRNKSDNAKLVNSFQAYMVVVRIPTGQVILFWEITFSQVK